MLEYNIFCEKCKKFLGTMLNPVHLRGWYCNKCIESGKEDPEDFWEEQRKSYDEDDFWKLE